MAGGGLPRPLLLFLPSPAATAAAISWPWYISVEFIVRLTKLSSASLRGKLPPSLPPASPPVTGAPSSRVVTITADCTSSRQSLSLLGSMCVSPGTAPLKRNSEVRLRSTSSGVTPSSVLEFGSAWWSRSTDTMSGETISAARCRAVLPVGPARELTSAAPSSSSALTTSRLQCCTA
ncbi:Os12g0138600 [Oryza sativa Japonica Group]|uniref:Os12g0138600 protein n=2 Tax=Oryza sativa subsp. japonica TaxID=39947 RepID=Q0IQ82_ORYSJ|nr:hypothetical protein EE612_057679 [Oryza sativa]BAF29133.1 Os12g0138600 [Oryza sativa Japonica Group]BAT15820.1 Os12g0138600 [Oryza sativa Japonica Group]|eukprot:NP_001066114.1 Os12g0138600 [Oryza sativa Japonica Group]